MDRYRLLEVNPASKWGKRIQTLGSGSYGEVYRTPLDAVKVYQTPPAGQFPEPGDIREVIYLTSTVAEHVIEIKSAWIENSKIWIRMPIAEISLSSRIVICPDSELLSLIFQICLGVYQLHSRGMAHLDLKPDNVVICQNKVKLLDLGLSRNQVSVEGAVLDGAPFSLPYTPPEDFMDLPLGYSSDIWSLGVLCLEVLSRKKFSPFYPFTRSQIRTFANRDNVAATIFERLGSPTAKNWPEGYEAYQKLKLGKPFSFSEPLKFKLRRYPEIIGRMLSLNPADRPTIVEILEDPWLSDFNSDLNLNPIFGGLDYLRQYLEPLTNSVESDWFYPYRKHLDYSAYDLALYLAGKFSESWNLIEFRTACMVVGTLVHQIETLTVQAWADITGVEPQELVKWVEWIFKETKFQLNITTAYTWLQYNLTRNTFQRMHREPLILFRISQCAGLQYLYPADQLAEILYHLAKECRTGSIAQKHVDPVHLAQIRAQLKTYLEQSQYSKELLRGWPNLMDHL